MRQLVTLIHERSLPSEVLLNLNIPAVPPTSLRGIKVGRLGRRVYRDELVVRYDPRGRPYYWIDGAEPEDHYEEGTDIAAISDGYASLTPVHMDLTSHRWLEELRSWELEG